MSEKTQPSTPPGRPRTRRGRLVRILAACLALAGVAGYLITQYATSGSGPARCTVTAAGGDGEDGDGGAAVYRIHPDQAANAATIEAVASSRGLPERAVTIALATAMQESGLRNIEYGDRDSIGLFQQRPSQGWGSKQQIMDPVYAAGKFYDHLVEVPGYSRLPLTVAAQKVQRSGFPQAYAKHEANASLLTAALTGRHAAALTCTMGAEAQSEVPGDAAQVREKLAREFGPAVLGVEGGEDSVAAGTGPGGGRSKPQAATRDRTAADADAANAADTANTAKTAADRDIVLPAAAPERGWELAHWAVAHAGRLHIERISYDGRVWTAERSEEGWRTAEEDDAAGTGSSSSVLLRVAAGA